MSADLLMLLWESTDALHRRFDKFPPKWEETLMVFEEESGEFINEVTAEGDRYSDTLVAREAADTIVTVLATLSALNISTSTFQAAVKYVAAKNAAKTHETHYIREDGKIARRVKA